MRIIHAPFYGVGVALHYGLYRVFAVEGGIPRDEHNRDDQ
jgi:hypothetical protein